MALIWTVLFYCGPERTMKLATVELSTIDDFLAFWIDGPGNAVLAPDLRTTLATYYVNYQGRFTPYIRRHYRSQVYEAERLIAGMIHPSVLEVGCGLGTESLWFGLQGARVLGIDINRARLCVANARRDWMKKELKQNFEVEFLQRSILDLDHGAFDLIWMEQALHHLEPRLEVFGKLAKLLQPGGYLVVSEANAFNPFMQLQLFLRRGFPTVGQMVDDNGKVHLYGNERILTPIALRRACAKVGIRTVQHRYFRCLPARSWSTRLAYVERMFPQWFPFPFTHYNFVGKKT